MTSSIVSAPLIGALIGLTGTLLASYGLDYHRKNRKRRRLRLALLTEIKHMEPRIDTLSNQIDMDNIKKISGDPIFTQVYESNADELSLLTQDEIAAVSSFYIHAIAVQRKIHQTSDDSGVTPGLAALNAAFPGLEYKKNAAVESLQKHISDPDSLNKTLEDIRTESGNIETQILKKG